MMNGAQTKRRPHCAGSSRSSHGTAEVQSAISISCKAAGARQSVGRCSRRDETTGKRRCRRPRCNAPPVRAQPPAPPLVLPLEPLQELQDLQAQDLQARQVSVEQSARQSSHWGRKAKVARRRAAMQGPARRQGLPRYRPWETSAPEAGRAPATRCQEQSPARHHRPLAASLRPRRHSTMGAVDGPIRFALVPRANLARRASKSATTAQIFVRTRRHTPA